MIWIAIAIEFIFVNYLFFFTLSNKVKVRIKKSKIFKSGQNYNTYTLKRKQNMESDSSRTEASSKKGSYMTTVILVSIVIMVYQGIANSDLGVISQLTHQKGNDWAGPLSTALLFMGSGLGSLYHKYIGKFSFKQCFFVGSFGYTLFISMGLIFVKIGFTELVQVLIFVGSFISGLIVSVFYNTQFNYINFLSKIDGQSVKYFGINMGMVQSSNLFGNFLSWLLIKPLGQFFYLVVMDIIVFLTSFGYMFVVKEPTKEEIDSIGKVADNAETIEME